MKKKIITFFLIIISYLSLCSCINFDTNITTTIKSNIYRGTLSSSGNLTTYFLKNKGDVPYVDFLDVTKSLLGRDIIDEKEENEIYYLTRSDNNSYMKIDPNLDTIYFSDYEAFVNLENNDIFNPKSEYYIYTKTLNNEKLDSNDITFDLSKYDIDIFLSKDIIYIPFQIYDTLIYSQIDVSLAFNGHDYYIVDSTYFLKRDYRTSYFSGRTQSGKRSSEMANFTYNHLMFTLDNFFGIKDTRNINSFDELCIEEGLKKGLISTNCEEFNSALNNLIYSYLDDGHSSFAISSNYLKYDANADAKYQDDYEGVRRNELSEAQNYLSILRQSKRGLSFIGNSYRDYYNISDNTIIITIDSFNFPTYDYYQVKPNQNNYSDDSFGILYYAFNTYIPSYEKKYNTKISNVVLDVTLNGGGYVDDCLGLLGFLSNDYYVTYQNYATKDISKTEFIVDTNLDKNFDDLDSYQDKYNFYILTSNYSFSCSNMLACICKEQNLATIIGEETGGGGAIVYNLCLADSTSINISGAYSLIYFDEENNIYYAENKIKPDYELSREFFYSPTIINSFIKTL